MFNYSLFVDDANAGEDRYETREARDSDDEDEKEYEKKIIEE